LTTKNTADREVSTFHSNPAAQKRGGDGSGAVFGDTVNAFSAESFAGYGFPAAQDYVSFFFFCFVYINCSFCLSCGIEW
jgi:hypothetical protein